MLSKGSKAYSVLKMKCPNCQEGNFFEGHPYKYSTMGQVKEQCPECNIKYSIEPGFYQGSYYVTYGLSVGLFIVVWALMSIFMPESGPIMLIVVITLSLLGLSPLLYALSKIIWANVFFNYSKDLPDNKS